MESGMRAKWAVPHVEKHLQLVFGVVGWVPWALAPICYCSSLSSSSSGPYPWSSPLSCDLLLLLLLFVVVLLFLLSPPPLIFWSPLLVVLLLTIYVSLVLLVFNLHLHNPLLIVAHGCYIAIAIAIPTTIYTTTTSFVCQGCTNGCDAVQKCHVASQMMWCYHGITRHHVIVSYHVMLSHPIASCHNVMSSCDGQWTLLWQIKFGFMQFFNYANCFDECNNCSHLLSWLLTREMD